MALTNEQSAILNRLVSQELDMLEDILEHGTYETEELKKADEDRVSDLWEILREI